MIPDFVWTDFSVPNLKFKYMAISKVKKIKISFKHIGDWAEWKTGFF